MKAAVLFFGILCIASLADADTTYVAGGSVSGSWTVEGSPYMIEGDLVVGADDSLYIAPGVRVFFTGHYALSIYGSLRAVGSEGDSVVFTADVSVDTLGWGSMQFLTALDGNELTYCVVENARGQYRGGGIFCQASSLTVTHSSVRYCQAGFGRGLYVMDNSTLVMEDSEIRDNPGITGTGGALQLWGVDVTLERCAILRNGAMDGGGIDLYNGALVLLDCLFEENAAGIWGGALFVSGISHVAASGCTFRGNSSLQGGAIDAQETTDLVLDHCLFEGNRAHNGTYGGSTGAVVAHGSSTTISHCTFVGNWDAQNSGTLSVSSPCEIANSVFAFAPQGGGIRFFNASANVHHCAFFENLDANFLGSIPFDLGVVDTVNANGDPSDSYFNIFLNPAFVDTAAGDYHLTAESPCIDAGDPASPPDPDGTVADMGAFYFDQLKAPDKAEPVAPRAYGLQPNYPNPFNSATQIVFTLPRAERVRLLVFDVAGRLVATLAEGSYEAGTHSVRFEAGHLPSGVYVYHLQTGSFSQSRKLVVLK